MSNLKRAIREAEEIIHGPYDARREDAYKLIGRLENLCRKKASGDFRISCSIRGCLIETICNDPRKLSSSWDSGDWLHDKLFALLDLAKLLEVYGEQ